MAWHALKTLTAQAVAKEIGRRLLSPLVDKEGVVKFWCTIYVLKKKYILFFLIVIKCFKQ